jgi:FAD/FMN-containing dehydrogenase
LFYLASQRGSISAEHGIGVMKPSVLHFSKSKPSIKMMKNIKDALDPNGILNPYKVIPADLD